MVRVKNLSAPETSRMSRRVHRAQTRAPSVNGSLTEGTFRVGGSASFIIDGEADFTAPVATPERDGLIPASMMGRLTEASSSGSGNLVMRNSQGQASFGTPSSDSHAATKAYVDGVAGGGLVVDTSAGTRITTQDGDLVSYDSGWRDVSSYLESSVSLGQVQIRRTTDSIHVYFFAIFGSSGGQSWINSSLPVGWRPYQAADFTSAVGSVTHGMQLNTASRLRWSWSFDYSSSDYSTNRPTSQAVSASVSFPASADLPSTLIGDPA